MEADDDDMRRVEAVINGTPEPPADTQPPSPSDEMAPVVDATQAA